MKYLVILVSFILTGSVAFAQSGKTFHDFEAQTIGGDNLNMASFTGKKVLVVNTASYCVYTPQYEELQELYEMYGGVSFEVIGFPSNDFLDQEPHSDSTINLFCQEYGITFQMMSKIKVKGQGIHEIYEWLTRESENGVKDAPVSWNFQKFMIDENGYWVDFAEPKTSPLNAQIVNWIAKGGPTGLVKNKNRLNKIALFPNPVTDMATLDLNLTETTEVEVALLDIMGQRVTQIHKGRLSSGEPITFSTQKLTPGLYFVRISHGEINKSLRLSVQAR